MCKLQPSDCHFHTRSGHCFRGVNSDGSATYVHAYCGRLTCRSCSRRICQALLRSIASAVSERGLCHHLVLTLPSAVTRHEAEPLVKSAFRKLVIAAKRAFGPLSFVWTLGATGRGCLHLHVLTNVDMTHGQRRGRRIRWLREKWRGLTGGYQVSSKEFPEADAWRLSHYIVLNLMQTVMSGLGLSRRYGCSRDIVLRPRRESADAAVWERLPLPSAAIAVEYGVDTLPVVNPTFTLPRENINDASASYGDAPAVSALERRPAAGGPTLPAAGPAGCGPRLQGKGGAHE